jgi:hypothetical protein
MGEGYIGDSPHPRPLSDAARGEGRKIRGEVHRYGAAEVSWVMITLLPAVVVGAFKPETVVVI